LLFIATTVNKLVFTILGYPMIGAGLIATGIPFAIKVPICLVDAKYYKKKAAEQKTSYEVEPALLNSQSSKMACGLAFKLHF